MERKTYLAAVVSIALAISFCASVGSAHGMTGKDQSSVKEKTPYQRLGGYDAIAAVVDDLIPRITGDKQLSHFFGGHGGDSKKRLRQLIVSSLRSQIVEKP